MRLILLCKVTKINTREQVNLYYKNSTLTQAASRMAITREFSLCRSSASRSGILNIRILPWGRPGVLGGGGKRGMRGGRGGGVATGGWLGARGRGGGEWKPGRSGGGWGWGRGCEGGKGPICGGGGIPMGCGGPLG